MTANAAFLEKTSPGQGRKLILRDLRSTALAAIFAYAVVGSSGSLATAIAETANPPKIKVYASSAGLGSPSRAMDVQAAPAMPSKEDAWRHEAIPGGPAMCDLRCRTGFFGYR